MLIIKNFFIPFLFDVNLFKIRSPKRARRLLIVLIEEITRFRDIVRGCFEKCVFASCFLSSSSRQRGNENVFANNWRPGGSLVLRVRKRHSCWPFNQRNCRSIKFEPVPIPCQRQCALHALLFHEIEKFLSFRAETTSSIMESLRKKDGRVGYLKLIDIVLFIVKNYLASINYSSIINKQIF